MKGSRGAPQCGFSNQTVDLLDRYLDEYATVDVMTDHELRDAMKEFSAWPTFPQLYAGQEFLGGADIIRELQDQGELGDVLGAEASLVSKVELTITDAAAAALRDAVDDNDGEAEALMVRLRIDARFYNDLSLGPKEAGDIFGASNGLTVAFDPVSARRAGGMKIDFVTEGGQTGFKIDCPKAPIGVRGMSVTELKDRLGDPDDSLRLYDVRTDEERDIATIPGAQVLDEAALDALSAMSRTTPVAIHCHHGGRSARAAQALADLGFCEVYNVVGGIDAWSQEVDPSVARY
jgi:monothiol glutaredoxin